MLHMEWRGHSGLHATCESFLMGLKRMGFFKDFSLLSPLAGSSASLGSATQAIWPGPRCWQYCNYISALPSQWYCSHWVCIFVSHFTR